MTYLQRLIGNMTIWAGAKMSLQSSNGSRQSQRNLWRLIEEITFLKVQYVKKKKKASKQK